MTASAVVLGALGLVATFLPDEALRAAGVAPVPFLKLVVQVAGALYLGFSVLDWMARDNLIGGIYGRPVAIANLMHFGSAALSMLKILAASRELGSLWPLTAVYTALAVAFGLVLLRSPVRTS